VDYLRFGLNIRATFIGFSVALMRATWLSFSTDSKKKKQKTPKKEIEKALRIKDDYFELKRKSK